MECCTDCTHSYLVGPSGGGLCLTCLGEAVPSQSTSDFLCSLRTLGAAFCLSSQDASHPITDTHGRPAAPTLLKAALQILSRAACMAAIEATDRTVYLTLRECVLAICRKAVAFSQPPSDTLTFYHTQSPAILGAESLASWEEPVTAEVTTVSMFADSFFHLVSDTARRGYTTSTETQALVVLLSDITEGSEPFRVCFGDALRLPRILALYGSAIVCRHTESTVGAYLFWVYRLICHARRKAASLELLARLLLRRTLDADADSSTDGGAFLSALLASLERFPDSPTVVNNALTIWFVVLSLETTSQAILLAQQGADLLLQALQWITPHTLSRKAEVAVLAVEVTRLLAGHMVPGTIPRHIAEIVEDYALEGLHGATPHSARSLVVLANTLAKHLCAPVTVSPAGGAAVEADCRPPLEGRDAHTLELFMQLASCSPEVCEEAVSGAYLARCIFGKDAASVGALAHTVVTVSAHIPSMTLFSYLALVQAIAVAAQRTSALAPEVLTSLCNQLVTRLRTCRSTNDSIPLAEVCENTAVPHHPRLPAVHSRAFMSLIRVVNYLLPACRQTAELASVAVDMLRDFRRGASLLPLLTHDGQQLHEAEAVQAAALGLFTTLLTWLLETTATDATKHDGPPWARDLRTLLEDGMLDFFLAETAFPSEHGVVDRARRALLDCCMATCQSFIGATTCAEVALRCEGSQASRFVMTLAALGCPQCVPLEDVSAAVVGAWDVLRAALVNDAGCSEEAGGQIAEEIEGVLQYCCSYYLWSRSLPTAPSIASIPAADWGVALRSDLVRRRLSAFVARGLAAAPSAFPRLCLELAQQPWASGFMAQLLILLVVDSLSSVECLGDAAVPTWRAGSPMTCLEGVWRRWWRTVAASGDLLDAIFAFLPTWRGEANATALLRLLAYILREDLRDAEPSLPGVAQRLLEQHLPRHVLSLRTALTTGTAPLPAGLVEAVAAVGVLGLLPLPPTVAGAADFGLMSWCLATLATGLPSDKDAGPHVALLQLMSVLLERGHGQELTARFEPSIRLLALSPPIATGGVRARCLRALIEHRLDIFSHGCRQGWHNLGPSDTPPICDRWCHYIPWVDTLRAAPPEGQRMCIAVLELLCFSSVWRGSVRGVCTTCTSEVYEATLEVLNACVGVMAAHMSAGGRSGTAAARVAYFLLRYYRVLLAPSWPALGIFLLCQATGGDCLQPAQRCWLLAGLLLVAHHRDELGGDMGPKVHALARDFIATLGDDGDAPPTQRRREEDFAAAAGEGTRTTSRDGVAADEDSRHIAAGMHALRDACRWHESLVPCEPISMHRIQDFYPRPACDGSLEAVDTLGFWGQRAHYVFLTDL